MNRNFGMPGMGGMPGMMPVMNPGMMPGMNGMGNMMGMSGIFMNQNPGMNFMMPGMNTGGNANWMSIYNNNIQQNNNMNMNNSVFGAPDNKINVVFKTTKGVITNVLIDKGKTMSYLFAVYLKKVDKYELFNKPNTIFFLFNAKRFDFLDDHKVEDIFSVIHYPTIVVNDIRGLIGS